MSGAYYNEFKAGGAAWLRELIKAGHIPAGDVDERSITDVRADDLVGYTQCHFFAGIGGWPLALRMVGWPDDAPIWSGSCPCQPYSLAGERQGTQDPRDLWPAFFGLIRERRPGDVVGEQVEPAIRWGWLDRLADDLEAEAYTVWPCVLPASAFGALHRRDRLCWAASADAHRVRPQGIGAPTEEPWSWEQFEGLVQAELRMAVPAGAIGGLSDGLPNRLVGLSGFGDAIVPQVAAAFIDAWLTS